MLTRNDRTVEDADGLVDAVCELGVTHIGFKDVGVPVATMRELVARIRRGGGGTLPRSGKYNTRSDRSARWRRRRARRRPHPRRHRSCGGAAHPGRPVRATFRFPAGRSAIRRGSKAPPRWSPSIARGRAALGCGGVDLLAYRATQADPLDLVRAARAGASGQAADRRRQRALRRSRSTRSPRRASTRSRSARRCSTARSRPARVACAGRSSTSSRPATRRRRLAA